MLIIASGVFLILAVDYADNLGPNTEEIGS